MRRSFLIAILALAAVAYIASPLRAAWVLREAVATGDTTTLERKVDWDRVRASLKTSLAKNAKLLPEIAASGEAIQPTLWQRVKAVFGATVLDRFVESYVTPTGLPKLFAEHLKLKRLTSSASAAEPASPLDRLSAFYHRIKRAEIKSLTSMELEIADEVDPSRHTICLMQLDGTEWKLVELKIISTEPAAAGGNGAGTHSAQASEQTPPS